MTDARHLYGLPLDRFVAERGALAKALRADGHREPAATVAGLRKPSLAAWAVNQLVRTQGRGVKTLFAAGDALVRAQSELLAQGADARPLREAAARERAAVGELAEAAQGLLSAQGHGLTQANLDRVSETLHAAAIDEDARAQVRDGCLERELRHVGLGATGAAIVSTDSARTGVRSPRKVAERKATPASPAESAAAAERDAAERARAQRAEREQAEKLKSARKVEAEARRNAERAAREVKAAQKRRDQAASSLRDAEAALAAAREGNEETALILRRAQQALGRG